MSDFLTFGEIMLRLRTNGYERFFQSPAFEATFGGGEANVAVSLCNYGLDAGFITALPDNDIGQNAINALRAVILIGRLYSKARNGCTSQVLPRPCHKALPTSLWNV